MHVAIIMDGNGRWAERRGLKRTAGHEAGARAVRRVAEAAVRSEIDVLTLYAFSSDNWSRPAEEVDRLMWLFERYLQNEVARCIETGVRVNVIGQRDRLGRDLVRTIEHVEQVTAHGERLTLQLAIDYSARAAIVHAANASKLDGGGNGHPGDTGRTVIQGFAARIACAMHSHIQESSVDLLIRTGGERRLSDFLLWECAYAELVFVDDCWPDFEESAFHAALEEFGRRERRFGGLSATGQARLVEDAH